MGIDLDTFRAGMRRLVGSVCIVATTTPDGRRAGLTATAVCSVSAEPPTLLVCVNRQNSSYDAIRESGFFAVNVLATEDHGLADRFAGRVSGEDKFLDGLWTQLETGAPILESALAGLDCRIAQVVEVGTHGIVFGHIEAVRLHQSDAKPLLYAHGTYGGFSVAASQAMF